MYLRPSLLVVLARQEGLDVNKVTASVEKRLKPLRRRLQLRAVEIEAEARDDPAEEPVAARYEGLLRLLLTPGRRVLVPLHDDPRTRVGRKCVNLRGHPGRTAVRVPPESRELEPN